ncbi:hypothetical protein LXL04_016330 [Taraxacum kok-saghyz]
MLRISNTVRVWLAVVNVENTDYSCWFIENLIDDLGLGLGNGLVIISHQHKSIMTKSSNAVDRVKNRKPDSSPIASSYDYKIRPILDAVDKLRLLKVTQEGIPLPTIVVVGDQSSGKSSVLESLARISLPRGQNICTRVPLIMRLQNHPDSHSELRLQYNNKSIKIMSESQISNAIDKATVEIAGNNKGISNVPLTLVVKKKDVPNLTMVDLPGITRVAVGDQPADIYKQITGMIMEYIKPEESIILNVLAANVDFATCESISMSRNVDPAGKRTLAVVTKSDKSPDGLLEKVTANDVNIGLGYICVRNRIKDETYEEARIQEAKHFDTHPLLSNMDKSMVGIPILADTLVQIQSTMISKCLPEIVKKINERLNASVFELNKLPRIITSKADAIATFMQIVGSFKETLQKILIRGEFDHVDDKEMHFNARLVEMLDVFSKEIHASEKSSEMFLVDEMEVLVEANRIRLPHLIQRYAFECLLKKKVNNISHFPVSFVNKVWTYLDFVCVKILNDHCKNYPQLVPSIKKASQNVVLKTKEKFLERAVEMMEMEEVTNYTCDPDFIASWNKLRNSHGEFLKAIHNRGSSFYMESNSMDIKHLWSVPATKRDEAFDLKMRMTAYWKIVSKRMVEWMAVQLHFLIQKLVNEEMEAEIINEVVVHGGGMEKMLEEQTSVVAKRERLQRSVSLLRESKEIIEGGGCRGGMSMVIGLCWVDRVKRVLALCLKIIVIAVVVVIVVVIGGGVIDGPSVRPD